MDLNRDRVPTLAKQVLTFSLVTLAWVFFRAESAGDAWLILRRIVTGGLADPAFPLLMAGLVLSIWLSQYVYESRLRGLLRPAPVRVGLVVGMALYMAAFITSGERAFYYLQF